MPGAIDALFSVWRTVGPLVFFFRPRHGYLDDYDLCGCVSAPYVERELHQGRDVRCLVGRLYLPGGHSILVLNCELTCQICSPGNPPLNMIIFARFC